MAVRNLLFWLAQGRRLSRLGASPVLPAPQSGDALAGGALLAGGPDGAEGASVDLPVRSPSLPANRILVQWQPGATASQRSTALRSIRGAKLKGTLESAPGLGLVEVIELPPGQTQNAATQAYRRRGGVALAEPDWVVGVQATSDDPAYTGGSLWGMYSSDSPTSAGGSGTTNVYGSQAEQAWARDFTGSSKVVVGVIDEGIDYTHPDLYRNIWLNQGEIRSLSFFSRLTDADGDGLITFHDLNDSRNSNFVEDVNLNSRIDAGDLLSDTRWADGTDGDGNGYRDDLVGWDFYNNSNDPFRASDGDNHGTHVAGTIGAIGGNGLGVAGVNWTAQLMPLKFLGPDGGYLSGAIAATNYYAAMTRSHDVDFGGKAQYVGTSNSWGGGGYSSTLNNAILNGAKVGNLFVAAAGNSASNNDTTASYPANYSTTSALGWDAVISVASITSTGGLSSFSNYGANSVDLGAPGSGINSTVAGGKYASYSGTSMATPHVSGALALMAAANPQATPQGLVQALFNGTASTPSLAGKTVTGGRLDVNAAMQQLLPGDPGDGGGDGDTDAPEPPPTSSPTYALIPSAAAVNEGASVGFTLTTTNVVQGTSLVWKISGIDAADVAGGQLQGTLNVGSDGKASFNVALAADQLTEPTPEAFTASVFSDATTTTPLASATPVTVNDTSQTPSTDQPLVLWGTTGNDVITGRSANDQLAGVRSSGTRAADLGRNQVDTLTGAAGADLFLLADRRGTFYNDGSSRSQGTGDYARIKDFNLAEGDRLQLRAGSQFLYRNVTLNGIATTEIFLGNGDNSFSAADELIARLEKTALAPASGVYILGNQSWTTYV